MSEGSISATPLWKKGKQGPELPPFRKGWPGGIFPPFVKGGFRGDLLADDLFQLIDAGDAAVE